MDLLEYKVCVYKDTFTAQNCTSGNLSSLSTENRNVLETLLSGTEPNSTLAEKLQEIKTNQIINRICLIISCVLSLILIGIIVYRLRHRFKKIWKRNAMITIPDIGIEAEFQLMNAPKTQKNSLNADHSSNTNEETISLLRHMTKESFSSVKTFNEYDAPSLSSSQEINNDHTNDIDSLMEGNSQALLVLENIKSLNQTVSKCDARNEASTSVETVCEIESLRYGVERECIIHLTSPDGKSNKVESEDGHGDETNLQIEIGEKGSDIDFQRYDWDNIFLFMIDKLIIATEYRLFFIMLYGELGFENPDNKISLIEMETGIKDSRYKLLMLLLYWRKEVGVHVNPVDIERAFEKIGWNSQLKDFKEYISKLPLKETRTTYHSIPDQSMFSQIKNSLLASNTMAMPVIMNLLEQLTSDPATNIDIQTTEEYKIQRLSNGSDVIETVNIKRRRRKLPLHKNEDSDIFEPVSKYKRVGNNADHCKTKNSNIRRYGKKCKKPVPMYESPIPLPGLSLSASSSTPAAETTSLSVAASEATLSSAAHETSEDASYSESSYESGFYSASSNLSSSGTDKNLVMNSEESRIQKACLKNHLNDSSCPCQNEDLTMTALQTANDKIIPSRNIVEPLASPGFKYKGRHLCNSLNGVKCRATTCSWNVSSVEQVFSNSTLVGTKEDRRISGKRKAETLDEYPYKKGQSTKELKPTKKLRNLVQQNRNLKKQDQLKTALLIKHIEKSLQNKAPVERYEFDIFLKDLLQRLSMHPTDHDILSMRMQSYLNADSIVTHQNEKVRLVYCGKSFLVLREKEWTSLQIYVELARNDLLRKTQSNFNTDVIFLNYDGEIWL